MERRVVWVCWFQGNCWETGRGDKARVDGVVERRAMGLRGIAEAHGQTGQGGGREIEIAAGMGRWEAFARAARVNTFDAAAQATGDAEGRGGTGGGEGTGDGVAEVVQRKITVAINT